MVDLEALLVIALKRAMHYLTKDDLARICQADPKQVVETIASLVERGYRVEEIPGEGYRLIDLPEIIDDVSLKTLLHTRFIGSQILTFKSVTSTNDVAFKLGRAGAINGTVVIADEQKMGRGRLGRSWHSPQGCGLWFSILLRPDLSLPDSSTISLASALSVAQILIEEFGIRAEIKWPNDVVVNGKKICGILTEAECVGEEVKFVVLGIGINVSNREDDFPPDLSSATSVMIEAGVKPSRAHLLARVLERFEIEYNKLCEEGFGAIRPKIIGLTSLLGKMIRVKSGQKEIEGMAFDIDHTGGLVIRTESGSTVRLTVGEVIKVD